VLNCGHPPPLLVRAGRATELEPPEPAPPLGLAARPEPLRLRLALGDRILLSTDGASEARAAGGFFPLQAAAAFAPVSADLEAGLESLWAELQATSPGNSTTTSPCCSSNAAADPARWCQPLHWPVCAAQPGRRVRPVPRRRPSSQGRPEAGPKDPRSAL
jgi:hypothetical protein